MAFFYIGHLQKSQRIALSVLQYYFREWIYKELREKKNYGYVASSFTDVFYQNYGVMVLLNGEKFKPEEVEAVIFERINAFVEEFKKMDPKTLKSNAKNQWQEKLKLKGLLHNVSHRIFHYWQDEELFDLKSEYMEELERFDYKESFDLADKYLKENGKILILEMCSEQFTPDRAKFILDKKLTMGEKGYQLADIDKY